MPSKTSPACRRCHCGDDMCQPIQDVKPSLLFVNGVRPSSTKVPVSTASAPDPADPGTASGRPLSHPDAPDYSGRLAPRGRGRRALYPAQGQSQAATHCEEPVGSANSIRRGRRRRPSSPRCARSRTGHRRPRHGCCRTQFGPLYRTCSSSTLHSAAPRALNPGAVFFAQNRDAANALVEFKSVGCGLLGP